MSDLTATNCGCGRERSGNNSCLWIILLLLFCGNSFGGDGNFLSNDNDGGCGCILPILLILCCCGGGF